MTIRDTIKQALEFRYTCATCHVQLREGDRFAVLGTMSPKILHGAITNTLRQVELLGELHCELCARARLCGR